MPSCSYKPVNRFLIYCYYSNFEQQSDEKTQHLMKTLSDKRRLFLGGHRLGIFDVLII